MRLNGWSNSLYTAELGLSSLQTFYKEKSMKYSLLAITLLILTLSACGGAKNQALPATQQEAYEKALKGEEIECPNGADSNGSCR